MRKVRISNKHLRHFTFLILIFIITTAQYPELKTIEEDLPIIRKYFNHCRKVLKKHLSEIKSYIKELNLVSKDEEKYKYVIEKHSSLSIEKEYLVDSAEYIYRINYPDKMFWCINRMLGVIMFDPVGKPSIKYYIKTDEKSNYTEKVTLPHDYSYSINYYRDTITNRITFHDTYSIFYSQTTCGYDNYVNYKGYRYSFGGTLSLTNRLKDEMFVNDNLNKENIQIIKEAFFYKTLWFDLYIKVKAEKLFNHYRKIFIFLINHLRKEVGLTPVTESQKLNAAAFNHSQYVKSKIEDDNSFEYKELYVQDEENDKFFGKYLDDRIAFHGYKYPADENIISCNNIISCVVKLLTKPSSRETIYNPQLTEIGFAKIDDKLYRKSNEYSKNFYVIIFGKKNFREKLKFPIMFPPDKSRNVPVLSFVKNKKRGFPVSISLRNQNIIEGKISVFDYNKKKIEEYHSNQKYTSSDFINFVAEKPLNFNTIYYVKFTGLNENRSKINYFWSFKTEYQNFTIIK